MTPEIEMVKTVMAVMVAGVEEKAANAWPRYGGSITCPINR